MRTILRLFFTALYFVVFGFGIDAVFRHTHSILTDLLTVVCWGVALIVSAALAEYTLQKIREHLDR